MASSPQIPLQFQQHENFEFANYTAGKNQELLSVLNKLAKAKQTARVYVWGESELGKSHLLHALCKQAQEQQLSAIYLPLYELINYSPEVLQGIENYDIVCLDDIDAIKQKKDWQEALFHLYNQINDANKSLVITSSGSIKELDLSLADLSSRLSWGLTYHLQALGDEDKKKLLQQKAHERSFELTDEVVNYLVARTERSMKSLLNILDELDHASLSEQRKITIPFVKQLLEK